MESRHRHAAVIVFLQRAVALACITSHADYPNILFCKSFSIGITIQCRHIWLMPMSPIQYRKAAIFAIGRRLGLFSKPIYRKIYFTTAKSMVIDRMVTPFIIWVISYPCLPSFNPVWAPFIFLHISLPPFKILRIFVIRFKIAPTAHIF